ncbi:GFA family protein [Roseovarius sp.]|uniref:GFA family protein n=1 Tax=Roseovarius sp. TaxID=1486281 RepID=UPI003BABF026
MTCTGSCLCGAVKIEFAEAPKETGACHCNMCRKWSGGVYLAIPVAAGKATFEGEDSIARYPSSDWAERAFCKTCGTNLFYRLTAPGPHQGDMFVCLGLLDDPSGVTLTEEVFYDEKPAGYAFAGDTHKMTGAEVIAQFAPGG